jgi:hypothetical protein
MIEDGVEALRVVEDEQPPGGVLERAADGRGDLGRRRIGGDGKSQRGGQRREVLEEGLGGLRTEPTDQAAVVGIFRAPPRNLVFTGRDQRGRASVCGAPRCGRGRRRAEVCG